MKTCWADTETTGVVPNKHDVVQIAGMVEMDGEILEEFDFRCRPHNPENIDERAFAVNGLSREIVMEYEDPSITLRSFIMLLKRHTEEGVMQLAGYNAAFDKRMLVGWAIKGGVTYIDNFFDYKNNDIFSLFKSYAKTLPKGTLPNNKLITATAHFGIPHDAHEAMSDIRATRELAMILDGYMERGVTND